MPKFNTTIEVEIEVEYTVDQELRQGDDARYPSQPYVDDISGISLKGSNFDIQADLDKDTLEQIKDEAFHHLKKLEKEFE